MPRSGLSRKPNIPKKKLIPGIIRPDLEQHMKLTHLSDTHLSNR